MYRMKVWEIIIPQLKEGHKYVITPEKIMELADSEDISYIIETCEEGGVGWTRTYSSPLFFTREDAEKAVAFFSFLGIDRKYFKDVNKIYFTFEKKFIKLKAGE